MEIKLNENERLEDLEFKGLKIIQNKELYTFTSDSVVLANFVKIKSKERAVEIGAGSGVISILLTAKMPAKDIVAFELQKEMASLAERNVELNKLQDKIKIVCDDAKNYKKYVEGQSFDVVFSNPPYMVTPRDMREGVRDLSRHDKMLPIDKLCLVASSMLKFGGRFYVVYTATRSSELIFELIKNKLEPKRMFFTENGKGRVVLVVIEAVKGGSHGVTVLPNLVTNDKDGKYLEVLKTSYVG